MAEITVEELHKLENPYEGFSEELSEYLSDWGIERLSQDDLEDYLEWWPIAVEPRVTRAVGELVVDREVYAMAERAGWVGRYGLASGQARNYWSPSI